MNRVSCVLIGVLLLMVPPYAFARSGDPDYETLAAEISGIETALAAGEISEEHLETLTEITGRLETTPYRDLRNKAGILLYLTRQELSRLTIEENRAAVEAELAENLEEEKNSQRALQKKENLLVPALVAGGLALLVSDLAFVFSDAAYERYITAEDAAVGGYYQQMWQTLDLTGLLSGTLGFAAILCASGCIAAVEAPAVTGSREPSYNPEERYALTDPEKRLAAVEEDLRETAESLEKARLRLRQCETAQRVFLSAGLLSFLTSGVGYYLMEETGRHMESDPDNQDIRNNYNLYEQISGYAALGGFSCLTGSLLLQVVRPRPALLEDRMVEIEAYKRSLE